MRKVFKNQGGFLSIQGLIIAGVSLSASIIGVASYGAISVPTESSLLPTVGSVCVTATYESDPEITAQAGYCGIGESDSTNPPSPPEIIREPTMLTTWNTSLDPKCREITLPISGNVDTTINWGDDSEAQVVTSDNPTYTFNEDNEAREILISGTFDSWGNTGWADSGCLLSVDEWEDTETTDLGYAFHNADNLRHVEEIPPSTKDLKYAFYQVDSAFTLGNFDTINVIDMRCMFYYASKFNHPVKFNTSNIEYIQFMFRGAEKFNQPVEFDTKKALTMSYMFFDAKEFDQPVKFDTSKVTTMLNMFRGATKFDQTVEFNTSNVNDIGGMFYKAEAFNKPLDFDTKKVTNMSRMFLGADSFDQTIKFDGSELVDTSFMFKDTENFNSPVTISNTNKLNTIRYMFYGAQRFNKTVDLNISNVENMKYVLGEALDFNQDLSNWSTDKVIDYYGFDQSASKWNSENKPNFSKPSVHIPMVEDGDTK